MKVYTSRMMVFVLSFMLDLQVSIAAERFEFFNGVRQMGMGGASIGVVNDETSLLSNPNGLGKLRNSIFTVIDPEGSVTNNFYSHIIDGKNPFDFIELENILGYLNDNPSETDVYSRLQIFPSYVNTNFGIGLFKKMNYSAVLNDDGISANTNFYDDTALLLGYNFRLLGGRIKLGFTGKYINRATFSEDLALATPNPDVKDYVSEGIGIGLDVGLSLTAPWTYLPTISAVVRDAGNTSFRSNSGMFYDTENRPESLKQTYDVAFSLFPIHSNQVRSSITFELKDVENILEEEDIQRRSHAGWELNIGDIFFIRAGMNQRYWTAGFELALNNVQMQLATYGEDVGVDEAPVESRRIVTKFSYRF